MPNDERRLGRIPRIISQIGDLFLSSITLEGRILTGGKLKTAEFDKLLSMNENQLSAFLYPYLPDEDIDSELTANLVDIILDWARYRVPDHAAGKKLLASLSGYNRPDEQPIALTDKQHSNLAKVLTQVFPIELKAEFLSDSQEAEKIAVPKMRAIKTVLAACNFEQTSITNQPPVISVPLKEIFGSLEILSQREEMSVEDLILIARMAFKIAPHQNPPDSIRLQLLLLADPPNQLYSLNYLREWLINSQEMIELFLRNELLKFGAGKKEAKLWTNILATYVKTDKIPGGGFI